MSKAVSAARHRRIARVKRVFDVAGFGRFSLYRKISLRARRAVFPELAEAGASAPIEIDGVLLEVPREVFPEYLHRRLEPMTTKAWQADLDRLPPDAVVVDVGAFVGYYAFSAALRLPQGRVHAFEASPATQALLKTGIGRNGVANVSVHAVAADRRRGTRTFYVNELSTCSGLAPSHIAPTVEEVEVEARPVDELVSTPMRLMKIDVEGAEPDVLAGAAGLIARSPGAIVYVEWNPRCLRGAGHQPEALPAQLAALGIQKLEVLDHPSADGPLPAEALVGEAAQAPLWHVNLRGVVA